MTGLSRSVTRRLAQLATWLRQRANVPGRRSLTALDLVDRFPEASAALVTAATALERERILGILELALPGYGDVALEAVRDGACTPAAAAVRLIQAQRARAAAAAIVQKHEGLRLAFAPRRSQQTEVH